MTKAQPKWQTILDELTLEQEVIAIEHQDDGSRNFYMPRIGRMVDGRSVRALLDRQLIVAIPGAIDPEIPQAFEVAA